MKTKVKRMSKKTLSLFLGVMMLVSSIGLGSIIAANTATGDWYIVGNVNDGNNWSESDSVKFSSVSGGYSITVKLTQNKDFRIRHNNADYGAASSSDSDRKVNSSTSNHTLSSGNQTFIWTGNTGTYTVTINSDGSKISFDGSSPGGGGGSGGASSDKVYFDNTPDWSNVYVYFYSKKYWGSDKGSGSDSGGGCLNTSGTLMTTDATTGYLCAEIPDNTSYVVFLNASQNGYGNFWGTGTEAAMLVQSNDQVAFDDTKPLYTPDTSTSTSNVNGNVKYYYNGVWSALPSTYDNITATKSITGAASNDITISAPASAQDDVDGTTGITVTAVNNNSTHYTFDGWTSSNGTFANANNLSTTFYPTADNAVATANFTEKSYNVTVSKNPSAGGNITTATVGGHPYTATNLSSFGVSAKSGYHFTGWTTGTGVTLTNSSSSDPSTGTFKTTQASTLTANFAKSSYTLTKGTESNGTFTMSVDGSTIASGTSVEFQKEVTINCTPNKGYKVTAVKHGTTNATQDSSDENKWTFNMPASDKTVNVTFSKIDKSITKSVKPAKATLVVSKTSGGSNTDTYNIGDTLYLRCTSVDNAYNVSSYKVTFGDGTVQTYSGTTANFTVNETLYGTTGELTIEALLVLKPTYPITLVTNNSAYGTLSSSVAAAYSGQSVTITINENTGTLSSITAKKADNSSQSLSGSGSTRTFTMPAQAVTVTATFTEYVGTSDWYYNGYSTSDMMGTGVNDGYAKQMSKGKVDNKEFSYYHVESRTGNNQLFTVSYKSPAHSYTDSDYIYFHGTKSDADVDWAKEHNIGCWFTSSDGLTIGTYHQMSYADYSEGYKMWRSKVPYGAKYINFKDESKNCTWTGVDLSQGDDDRYNMCYWTDGSSNGSYSVYGYSNPVPKGFHEYFYNMSSVYYNTTDHSFGSYNVQIAGATHVIPNPSSATTSDYYVVVLNPGNTYTINDDTISVPSGDTPYIVYTSELPNKTVGKVKVYAKDGSVRSDTTTSGTIGNTVITYDTTNYPGVGTVSTHSGTGNAANCDYQTAYVSKGSTVKITTTLENDFKSTHYVKAFMVNGKGAKFFTHSNDGVYTMEYTIPEDFEGKTLEVTPVYFLKNESDTVTFKIEGFDPRVQTTGKWGTTLFAYPFYAETVAGYQSAFYGYPGQPVVEDNGKYYIQIPVNNTNPADTNHTKVRGITLSNGYLDDVHKICESTNLTDHRQTYDYDDFYKIYNEKAPDNITFSFKYTGTDISNAHTSVSAERTAGHNPGASFTNQTTYSGWEDLKNYHGQRVNIFGEVLDNQETTNVLYIVSDGYWYNNAGSFGTEWNVYTKSGSNFTRIGTIVPSALTLNNADSFDKSAYSQYNDSTNGKHMLSSFKTFYNTLKSNYNNYRAEITYEHNILGGHYTRYNAVKSTTESGDDAAYRLDGRWTYSNDDDIINAKTQVRYLDTTHDDIYDSTEDTFADSTVDKPAGITTGAAAYFTNTTTNNAGASYQYKMATGEVYGDKTKSFTFATSVEATRTNNYVFKGWYLFKDGTYTKMDNASSPMNSNDTYVALYKQVNYSTITIDHQLADNSGAGETEVQVQVSGSSDPTKDKIYPYSSDAITAEVDQDSTVTVTLRSTSAGANTFNGWYGTAAKGDSLGNGGYSGVVDKATKQITIYSDEFYNGSTYTMKSKTYYSDFTNVTRQFKAVFHYTNRAGQNKTYTVKTLLDTYFVAAHPSSYSLTDTIGEGVTLKQWVKDSAPSMIDLYGKNIKWAMSDANLSDGFSYTNNRIDINSTTEAKKWTIMVETHSDGDIDNDSSRTIATKNNIPNNTYAEKSAGVYYTPDSETYDKFAYWSVFPLDLKTGEPKNDNELLRIYNYEFKVMITGNYYVKAIYTPGTVTKASVQEAVYSREVYDLDETGDTKKDDLYSDFIYSYMSERNSVELKNNSDYLSGLAVEVSQGTKVPEGTSKAVDYSEYTFDSENSNIESYVAAITASTANGAKIGSYTYTADGKSDKRSVYCYPILNSNYNNFNRGDFAIMYGSNQSWTKYIMKAYYYVKNKSTGAVQISEPVYFCLHNTKVTVFASSNTIVES